MELHRLNTGRQVQVSTAINRAVNHLFQYGGHVGVHSIFGGYDETGPHLAQVSASGFVAADVFISMGSGSMNAISILEARYHEDLTLEEAKALAVEAVSAGILYDNSSGANVDLCVITENNCEYLRNYKLIGKRLVPAQLNDVLIPDNLPTLGEKVYQLGKQGAKAQSEDSNKIVEEK